MPYEFLIHQFWGEVREPVPLTVKPGDFGTLLTWYQVIL